MLYKTEFGMDLYILDQDVTLPEEGEYYILASNGVFLKKDNGLVSGIVPVKGVSVLQELPNTNIVNHKFTKIPLDLVAMIKKFFSAVTEKLRSEACVILYYNKTTQKYVIEVPQQVVSHGSVHYEKKGVTSFDNMKGFVYAGTIHSHCDFQAFHSGTDVNDEEHADGLHLTFGHNDKNIFTISGCVVLNGVRTKISPEVVLEGIVARGDEHWSLNIPIDQVEVPEDWYRQVTPFTFSRSNFSNKGNEIEKYLR